MKRPSVRCPKFDRSAFAGYRFSPEVIRLAVRWYLRFGLSYSDIEELLAERGVEVDHVSVYRWVQTFTPLLIDAAHLMRRIAEATDSTDAKVDQAMLVGMYGRDDAAHSADG